MQSSIAFCDAPSGVHLEPKQYSSNIQIFKRFRSFLDLFWTLVTRSCLKGTSWRYQEIFAWVFIVCLIYCAWFFVCLIVYLLNILFVCLLGNPVNHSQWFGWFPNEVVFNFRVIFSRYAIPSYRAASRVALHHFRTSGSHGCVVKLYLVLLIAQSAGILIWNTSLTFHQTNVSDIKSKRFFFLNDRTAGTDIVN